MAKLLCAMVLIVGCAQGQTTAPSTYDAAPPAQVAAKDTLPAPGKPGGEVGLVRGVLKRLDPIHDQLLIRPFGGGEVRVAFDARTQVLPENTRLRFDSVPTGSVVSVDTVIDRGKLFARSVRRSQSDAAELNGQVVRYDATRSQLTLRDPVSPKSVSLRITPSTIVVNRNQPASSQVLTPGMLVQVWFTPTGNAATRVEILAERGSSFSFEGRIVSVDFDSRVVSLLNDSDQSVRELAIGSLDAGSQRLLREGADVSIQAEFDGNHYYARAVTGVSRNP